MSDVYYDLYLDTNEGDGGDGKSRFSQVVSFFFKSVFAIIAIGVIGILAYRIITMQEPGMTDDFLANNVTLSSMSDNAQSATNSDYDEYYVDFRTFMGVKLVRRRDSDVQNLTTEQYGYHGFQVFTQHLVNYYVLNEETQEYDTVERSEFYTAKNEDEGNFKISNQYFMPQSGQICITFRYNENAKKNLGSAYEGAEKEDSPFVLVISDNKGNEYGKYSYTEAKRANYYYQRMLFDGIDFSGVNTLYLDIYYKDDTGIEAPYRSMVIYDANLPLEEVKVKTPKTTTQGMKSCEVITKNNTNAKGTEEE